MVLQNNGKFCNGFITNYVCITQQMCHVMSFFAIALG
jgi:hypothetical protein